MAPTFEEQAERGSRPVPQAQGGALYVSGSEIHDDFRSGESDIDLLVEFAPTGVHAKTHTYFELLDELRELLGTGIDLVKAGRSATSRYRGRSRRVIRYTRFSLASTFRLRGFA